MMTSSLLLSSIIYCSSIIMVIGQASPVVGKSVHYTGRRCSFSSKSQLSCLGFLFQNSAHSHLTCGACTSFTPFWSSHLLAYFTAFPSPLFSHVNLGTIIILSSLRAMRWLSVITCFHSVYPFPATCFLQIIITRPFAPSDFRYVLMLYLPSLAL